MPGGNEQLGFVFPFVGMGVFKVERETYGSTDMCGSPMGG